MKKFTASALALLATVTLAGCASSDTVATVGENTVTKDDLYESMKASVGESTIQRLILTQALENLVGENEYKKQAETEVLATIESVGGVDTLLGLIQQMGFTSQEEYTSQIHLNLLMDDALRARTTFTDEEVQAFFNEHELTGGAAELYRLLGQSELFDVYRLCAVMILQQRVFDQMQVLFASQEDMEAVPHGVDTDVRQQAYDQAMQLRRLEFELMERAYEDFEKQVRGSPPPDVCSRTMVKEE